MENKVELSRNTTVQSLDDQNNTIDVPAVQTVQIEKEADGTLFTSIIHDGEELAMSLDNFLKLKLLMTEAADLFAKTVK